MARVAVLGPGAVGAAVAVALVHGGHEVIACARTAASEFALDSPSGALVAAPAVLTDPAAMPAVDAVLVATKTHQTEGAARWLARTRAPVAVLQNGVEHVERFASHAGRERIVPALVFGPVERVAPGRARVITSLSLTFPDDERAREFVALFHGTAVAARTTHDWRTEAWRKLALAAPAALEALHGEPARVFHRDDVAREARALALEAIAVGRAEGAALDDTVADDVVRALRAKPPDAWSSLALDHRAGRPTELDARNGAIVRLGPRHGVPTPRNASVVAGLGGV